MKEQRYPPELSKQAKKQIDIMDAKTQQRIKNGIEKIPLGDIVPLKSNAEYSRLRIGSYRILFKWINNEQIFVVLIESRGQVYKRGV